MASCDKIAISLRDAETNKICTISETSEEANCSETDNNNSSTEIELIEDIDKTSDGIQEEAEKFKWPHKAILLLIEEYRLRQSDFTNGIMFQTKIWLLVAAEMLKHGYTVTGPQCLSKFSSLKRTYRTYIKDYKSGSGTRTWPYFSLIDDLPGTKPFMSPVTTIFSTGKRSRTESVCSTSDCSDENENSQPKKIRQTPPIEKLMEYLRNEIRVAEEAQEKRHRENIELRQRLLNSFDKMLNILEKK